MLKPVIASRIALDANGRLRVYPHSINGHNEMIYRDASSVRWDKSDQSYFVLPVDGFTPLDEFNQIRKALEREFGQLLVLDDSTRIELEPVLANALRSRGANASESR